MSLIEISPLILFVFVSTVTPGGATTVATASGAHFGFQRSLPFMCGIAIGLATMAAVAAVGLGSIIISFPVLQLIMKIVGSLYLIWLACKMALAGPPNLHANISKPVGFIGAIWLVWHNPKGWAMTLGASASFASLSDVPTHLSFLLGASFAIAAMISLSLWCAAGLLLARILKTNRQWHIFNTLLGLLLASSIVTMWIE
ncbi:threonine/homoserine/homoserine lactone efflux protein [Erwinia toletana]|uniref:Threonine/homoserine/homoserine lactone efflux protein n=1 Tax=Winslowiella toletana TaxID=92490 RepID=A0ABS4PDU0_9GAMM|nr:LysE family translocator [Winslowiella toletana]MBP2170798.1 threonine/homoserine/homoserine lactone efflux protein [Winslowiella toletana]